MKKLIPVMLVLFLLANNSNVNRVRADTSNKGPLTPPTQPVQPNVSRIYAESDGITAVIDPARNTLLANISDPNTWGPIVYGTSTNDVYLCSFDGSYVDAISAASNSVVASVSLPEGPCPMTYDFKNGNVYVSMFGSNYVAAISGATNAVVANIPVAQRFVTGPAAITFDPFNGDIYVGVWTLRSASHPNTHSLARIGAQL